MQPEQPDFLALVQEYAVIHSSCVGLTAAGAQEAAANHHAREVELFDLVEARLNTDRAESYQRGLAEGRRQATEGAEHLRRPFFHTEPANGVTLAVTYQGADGLAFVAQPPRAATELYEQYGVVLPRDVARDLALRMLASVGPWEPAEQPEAGSWRLAEWAALPNECFIDGCSGSDIDQRGPVFIKGGLIRKACVEHWEPIFRVLGEHAAWERTDAMTSGPAEPASGGVVEPSPLTAEEADPITPEVYAEHFPERDDTGKPLTAEEATPDWGGDHAEAEGCDRTDMPEMASMICACGARAGDHRAWKRRHGRRQHDPSLLMEEPDLYPKTHDPDDERRADDAHLAAGEAWMEHAAEQSEGDSRG